MILFGEKLRESAERLGISNAEVANRAGLSERRYGHYVTSTREPDLATLVRIAQVLNTTPNDLLGFEESSRKQSKHAQIIERLHAAEETLAADDLEILLVLADGLVRRRRPTKRVRK